MYNHGKSGVIQIGINRNLIMTGHDGPMREVLDGYTKFLQEKNLALDKHQPYRSGPRILDSRSA
jgi:hypothetical protein